jgi:hypothetical protein
MHSSKKGRAFQTDEKEQLISGSHRFPWLGAVREEFL